MKQSYLLKPPQFTETAIAFDAGPARRIMHNDPPVLD
jgi:hypothetical protein